MKERQARSIGFIWEYLHEWGMIEEPIDVVDDGERLLHRSEVRNVKRVMVCTACFYMRRCHPTFLKYAPPWIDFSIRYAKADEIMDFEFE